MRKEIARRNIEQFAIYIEPNLSMTEFHEKYYELLTKFAAGEIRKLIISVPPQHGKSYGASKMLPAYMLGINPNLRICIGSYSFSLARRFGIGVQRVIESTQYNELFPNTMLKKSGAVDAMAMRTADEFDIIGKNGGLKLVGREGALTGSRVDVMILDDLYKDAAEAASPLVREAVWEWYCSVVRTRLHNRSQEIIVFTRWHEADLIGRLMEIEPAKWKMFNFPALKVGKATKLDQRENGEALWPQMHSKKLLEERRELDPAIFEALYQGNPKPKEGLLYGQFDTYNEMQEPIVRRGAYVDTADTGTDLLCAICYNVAQSGKIFVVDILYTEQPMEITEGLVAKMLVDADTQIAYVESNNGGRGFARAIARQVRCRIVPFHQNANKEARILSNATSVVRSIVMPNGWREKWRDFEHAISSFRRVVAANAHDDAADALTGIVEKECPDNASKKKINATWISLKGGT